MENNLQTRDFFALVEKSKEILILMPQAASDDLIGSAFGVAHFLAKFDKNVSILLETELPQRLDFLKKPGNIRADLKGCRDFILYFKTEKTRIKNVETKDEGNRFVIRITPEKGSLDSRDFSFVPADFNYNLIIALGVPAMDFLGKLYQENADLFLEVPKVNIDNQAINENFGQANLVDVTAACVSEVCANVFVEKDEKLVDRSVSQALLTGIISATESFQTPTTTPKTLVTAAKLMKLDADQQTIIRHLYKTRSLSFLKLWGRVMARLKWNEDKKVAWSILEMEDFVQSNSTEKDVPFALEEIQKNFSAGKAFAVFYAETPKITRGQLLVLDKNVAQKLARMYGGEVSGNIVRVRLEDKNTEEAEKDFVKKIEEAMK